MTRPFDNRTDVAWLAGLLEGEGCFYSSLDRREVVVTCHMTDRDVLERAKDISGVGHIYGPIEPGGDEAHRKTAWQYRVNARDEAYALSVAVYPFMHTRRQRAIRQLIRVYRTLGPVNDSPLRGDVDEIVRRYRTENVTYQQLADEYGVHPSAIGYHVRKRRAA